MSDLDALDLSGLAQFRPSDFFAPGAGVSDPVAAVHVDLGSIDFDPRQPRRSFRQESIALLGQSIRQHGVLEPVSLRRHPEQPDRFIVNRGERRVRAARDAGLATVPAFVDERIDPFAQAVENLHREDMSAFDLATFIEEREKEGLARQEIARRLSKPASFVSEAASLIGAPPELKAAVERGHVGSGVRTLYRLMSLMRESPEAMLAVVNGKEPVTRANVDALVEQARAGVRDDAAAVHSKAVPAVRSRGRSVLIVEHQGRRGSLRIKANGDDVGEVRYGDGSRAAVPLTALKLVCWATEESK